MGISPYTDLDRPPLHQAALARALVRPGSMWTSVRVVPATGSTNADLAAAARAGAPEGQVLVAEQQQAGRGRLGRTWTSPPRAGIACSVLLRPDLSPARYGWLPLLAGVVLVDVVRGLGEIDAAVKWPNDVLIGPDLRKCAGILAEAVPGPVRVGGAAGGSTQGGGGGPAIVLGIGLNVSLRPDELPRPDTTSLALAGSVCTDRDPLLRALLRGLADWYGRFVAAAGDAERSGLRTAYLDRSGTVGRTVRVQLPDGTDLSGPAVDVDGDGRLVVDDARGGPTTVAAGDIVHLR